MVTLRTEMGLTQARLAELLGISRRAVGEWEAGSSYPKAEHLKHLIELGIQRRAFHAGHEAEEIHALWNMARQKTPLDQQWLSTLLDQQPACLPHTQTHSFEQTRRNVVPYTYTDIGPRIDWGDALTMSVFYGREQEMAQLSHWILQEHCRLVILLGMGGIGKSALAVHAMDQFAQQFEVVIFRSLRDAPSCEELLEDCLQALAPQFLSTGPASLERRINLLLECLRATRTLLVLDNLESLLEEREVQGRLRPGLEGYGRLLRQVAETAHQSCLLLTSREMLADLRPLVGKHAPVRSLQLIGLDAPACERLFTEKDLIGSWHDQTRLVEAYVGNPLALKIVAETISDLFGGDIAQFLAEGATIFGTIADLLNEQLTRLSSLEQTVLYWLAIGREPMTFDELLTALVSSPPPVQVLEALHGLRRRSLIERGQRQGSFALQSVVLEYVTTVLVAEITSELQQGKLDRLIQHGLEQARTREYLRQTQERLLVAPILTHLQRAELGQTEVEVQLLLLLDQIRAWSDNAQGYAPANIIALLRLLRGHLRKLNLSQLSVRGAYLQGIEMQDTSLAGVLLRDTVFTEVLNAPWSVAISSSGEYWAAGSMQGEIHIWHKGIQTLHQVWHAHTDTTITLCFSPDERTLASGSWDGSVKVWEVDSGALCWESWHTRSVNCVTFAPDGSLLASSGNDVGIRLWDTRSGTLLQTLPHPHPVYALAWSPDGHLLASGDFNGAIRLWDMQQIPPTTCAELLSAHSNWVPGLAFAPDGSILASASWDHTVKLWQIPNGRLLQTLSEYTDRLHRVAWSPDGRTLASCGVATKIWLWDVEQARYRAVLHGHTAGMYGLAFSPDSNHLLSGSEDGTLLVWDATSGQCIQALHGYAVSFYDIDWSPDSTQLVSGGTDRLVTIWDVNTCSPRRVLRGHSELVFGLTWSPDGHFIASSGWDAVRLWNSDSGDCLQILRNPDTPQTAFHGVMWSPDGQLLASGTDEHGVQVWNVSARRRQWVGHDGPVYIYDVAWSPDGTLLASTTDDGRVSLWDAQNGTLQQSLEGHHGIVNGIVWTSEGNRLISCSSEEGKGELCVWNIKRREREQYIAGFPGVVFAIAWDSTENLLISGGSDGILRWWNVQSGDCVRERVTHHVTIHALRISPDGRKLASCSDDGAIMIWDLHTFEHLHTLRHDRPYERLDITGIRGLSREQKAALQALGAIEKL
jgi:WD40 repeat protein